MYSFVVSPTSRTHQTSLSSSNLHSSKPSSRQDESGSSKSSSAQEFDGTRIFDEESNTHLNIPLNGDDMNHNQHHISHQHHQGKMLNGRTSSGHHHTPDLHHQIPIKRLNSHQLNQKFTQKHLQQTEDDEDPQIKQEHQQPPQNRVSKFLSQIIPPQNYRLVSDTPEWKKLVKHAEYIETTYLRNLLQEKERCDELYATHDGVYLDYSRQRINLETIDLLLDLAERQNLKERIDAMVNGEKINFTEDRAVLHTALRGKRPSEDDKERIIVDGDDVMEEVYDVLDQIKYFTEAVRSGEIRGFTGKRLRNIISVGIGGSYLGPEFLHECLKTEPEGVNKSLGYTLRFLSNVDPVDVARACDDLDPEETLIVIVSKTFTTAETMLNAMTVRQWLWDFMGDDKEVVRKHVVAVSSISSKDKVEAFGIDTEKYFFRFWDWVGGRYSVCSAVGGIPISLLYGYDLFEKFLMVGVTLLNVDFFLTALISNRV